MNLYAVSFLYISCEVVLSFLTVSFTVSLTVSFNAF